MTIGKHTDLEMTKLENLNILLDIILLRKERRLPELTSEKVRNYFKDLGVSKKQSKVNLVLRAAEVLRISPSAVSRFLNDINLSKDKFTQLSVVEIKMPHMLS